MNVARSVSLAVVVALAAASSASSAPKSPSTTVLAEFGGPFPAATLRNANAAAGGTAQIDLATDLGKRAIVLVYWIPKHTRSEQQLLEAQKRLAGRESTAVLYGVVAVGPGLSAETVGARAKEIGIRVPVLADEGFKIGQQLAVQAAPAIAVIDRYGRLRLANGGSLLQTIEYKMTVADALARVASTGELGTYGSLPRYEPAFELVGKQAPDFSAPSVTDGIVYRWSKLLDPNKLNVLVFWAIDCPHCRKSLPEIGQYIRGNPPGVNVVTVARCDNDAMRTKTREFVSLNGLPMATLADINSSVAEAYNVTGTPTAFVIRPSGIVESILPQGAENFAAQVEAKKKSLLPATGS